ncbi:unannotated protein [freshwater metagenome]|uniref:Unannotated protein n=1 Tax=freshwater metagenome TaxID=449393 RepID=A0A6J7P8Y1_9ZZZZ
MIDKDAIGSTDDGYVMQVELGKIREFARATQSANPAYLETANPVIPPTFLTTQQFWSTPGSGVFSKIKMDRRRLLHGAQEYIFHGPPPSAGTTLSVQTRIDDIYEKEGRRGGTMTFVVSVTEFRDADGVLVAEARSTAIETGRAPEKDAS